jgi:hypothetical protein
MRNKQKDSQQKAGSLDTSILLIPVVGVEPTLLAEHDFESGS